MTTFFARLTWNWDAWRLPSGHRARGEHGTYVTRLGFGHEEWLNRSEWIVDGWRYGFVEGVGRSPALQGSKIDLILFAITPAKQRVIVGRISAAEVLDEEAAQAIHTQWKRRGWIRQMIKEVQEQTGDARRFRKSIAQPLVLANIRFRPTAIRIFDSPVPVPATDRLQAFSRYRLMAADQRFLKRWQGRLKRAPMKTFRPTEIQRRRRVGATSVDRIEARMQNELRVLLQHRYGATAVEAERDFADLRLASQGRQVLIEIKSTLRPRLAVRHALGQLLEYSCFDGSDAQPDLVVVGRGQATAAELRYVKRLRERFGIPIRYVQYIPGSNKVGLLIPAVRSNNLRMEPRRRHASAA